MSQISHNNQHWQLSGIVDISTVVPLLTASKALPMAADSTVDFAEVKHIDTAAISLILEWQRRAAAQNHSISFVNLPANLISLTQLYGVSAFVN